MWVRCGQCVGVGPWLVRRLGSERRFASKRATLSLDALSRMDTKATCGRTLPLPTPLLLPLPPPPPPALPLPPPPALPPPLPLVPLMALCLWDGRCLPKKWEGRRAQCALLSARVTTAAARAAKRAASAAIAGERSLRIARAKRIRLHAADTRL